MPYKQKPGRGPMMKTGRGLRKDLLGPAAHEPGHDGEKDKRFKYDPQGQQIGIKDFATGSYYTPSKKGFEAMKAKAEKIGRAPRAFEGELIEFGEAQRAAGYKMPSGKFVRANDPKKLESLREQFTKEKKFFDVKEAREAKRRGALLDYAGKLKK